MLISIESKVAHQAQVEFWPWARRMALVRMVGDHSIEDSAGALPAILAFKRPTA